MGLTADQRSRRVVGSPEVFDHETLTWRAFPAVRHSSGVQVCPAAEEARAFVGSLPGGPSRAVLDRIGQALQSARSGNRAVVWALGGEALEAGAAPLVIDLIEREEISCVCFDGDAARYDVENALFGVGLKAWQQNGEGGGLWTDTAGVWAEALRRGRGRRLGIGWALGDVLLGRRAPFVRESVLAACVSRRIPATVHCPAGCLGVELHHEFSGADFGEAGMIDFRVFLEAASTLDSGFWLQSGGFVPFGRLLCRAIALMGNAGRPVEQLTAVFAGPEPHRAVTEEVRALFYGEDRRSRRLELLAGTPDIVFPLVRAALSPTGVARDMYRDL
jgi:hypothetical protein